MHLVNVRGDQGSHLDKNPDSYLPFPNLQTSQSPGHRVCNSRVKQQGCNSRLEFVNLFMV